MSLRRSLPSANALFVFEAAARSLNFTRAGVELNVTQSAVSRMIARLEEHIQAKLFIRTPTGIELTESGRELYHAIANSFTNIDNVIDRIRGVPAGAGTVTVSLSTAFALHWFIPRFDRFQAKFPGIDLRFQLVRGEPVGPFEDVDFAVRYNLPEDENYWCWPLIEEIVVPVCSPDYLDAHGSLDQSGSTDGHTIIHLSGQTRIPWHRYLSDTPYQEAAARNLTFSDYSLVIQAALVGRGIALGWWHVVAHELQQKVLVPAPRPCCGPATTTSSSPAPADP